ncbi:mitochondrial ribosomal protein L37-domain-containing protein [Mycena rosella]|uniref:Large ribosomal subunit protein mL54 n=1 Tax=Mycena rosella TaxID=1033263 RepID=A0AAD7GM19_MYCRO|nr:mitochondrial ribosomal protein L37-domain-containing protein [Mycena rosella]
MSLLAFSTTILRRPCCGAAHLACRPRRTYASIPGKPAAKGLPSLKKASSCAPDTVIAGANYLKGQPPVLALPDEAYPEWLWRVLEKREWPDDGPGGRGERAERRAANKARIQDANFMKTQ